MPISKFNNDTTLSSISNWFFKSLSSSVELFIHDAIIPNKNKKSIGSDATKCRVQSYILLK
jgi:hypothetical protein